MLESLNDSTGAVGTVGVDKGALEADAMLRVRSGGTSDDSTDGGDVVVTSCPHDERVIA